MRGRSRAPRSTLPPWLMDVDAQTSIDALQADLAALSLTLVLGDWRIGRTDVAGECDTWAVATGQALTAAATATTRRPTVDPDGNGGLFFSATAGDRMTIPAAADFDIGLGGSLFAGLTIQGTGVPRNGLTLFNPDNTKSLRITTQSTSRIFIGQVTTPTSHLTSATGGTDSDDVDGGGLHIPRLVHVGYTGSSPLVIDVPDNDTRVSSGSPAAIPAGEDYHLDFYHQNGANQQEGRIYFWGYVTPQLTAPGLALVRAWGLSQHPKIVLT